MDSSLLEKFRQQLAIWIDYRLNNQPFPFQKLEVSPRTLTNIGRLAPDLVLWINRDSQLAGSIILLPAKVEDKSLAEGVALAEALGLNHFTTWDAREVCIWGLAKNSVEKIKSFPLPPAKHIIPQDFQDTLDKLLEQLKIVTVTHTLKRTELSAYYFVNICLRNLQELAPGLAISARIAAGQTEADEWVENAPHEKAWLCLWRILYLLWKDRLPPGLQPGRLEDAIRYALTDYENPELNLLSPGDDEPPLPDADAVRLYHLAARLRQLGWPHNSQESKTLVNLLLNEAAHRFDASPPEFPWAVKDAELYVSCPPHNVTKPCTVVAHRAYLAGWSLKSAITSQQGLFCFAEKLGDLDSQQPWRRAVASFKTSRSLMRKEYEENLILLRKTWPNRRFDLPRNTPAWVWDALFLAGLTRDGFTLTLPEDWLEAAGLGQLWEVLRERCHISNISLGSDDRPSLCFYHTSDAPVSCQLYRGGSAIEIPGHLTPLQAPGTIEFWLKGHMTVINTVIQIMSCNDSGQDQEDREALAYGLHYYLQTTLGRYIWDLCSNAAPLPEADKTLEAVNSYGVPRPDSGLLIELSQAFTLPGRTSPDIEQLDQEFEYLFGKIPRFDQAETNSLPAARKRNKRARFSPEKIAAKVFSDGVPRFPEHYLMDLYHADLVQYQLNGPMSVNENFFGRYTLQTQDRKHTLEVNGNALAEALILASYRGPGNVSVPSEAEILTQINSRYRADLHKLWDELVSECRRVAPIRKTAARLAKKIWAEKGLPPVDN